MGSIFQKTRTSPSSLARVAAALLLAVAGCGKPTTTITGIVTLDGNPVAGATLEFFPVSGKGLVSFTKTDAAGRYRAVVSPTPLKVIVTATKIDGKERNPFDPDGPPIDRVVSALPERYGFQEKTPLVAEPVEGQTMTIDFPLTSAAK